MEHENTSGLTSREDACIRVKQIADAIKKLKINNYLKIGGMSEEDKIAIAKLEEQMTVIAQENGREKLAEELKNYLGRYDDNEPANSKLESEQTLNLCRGAIDAEVASLKSGKISKAKRCQSKKKQYMKILEDKDDNATIKRAIEYQRGALSGLNKSLDNIKANDDLWRQKFKDCIKLEDFSDRKEIAKKIAEISVTKENGVHEVDTER